MNSNFIDNIKNYVNENFISEGTIGYLFALSTWQSLVAFLFVIFITITLIIIIKYKGKEFAIFASFALGILGMIIFGLMYQYTYNETLITDIFDRFPEIGEGKVTWVDESKTWLRIYTIIFFSGILIIIPLYIFTAIVAFIIDDKASKIGKKTFGASIISLLLLPLIGIIIALAFIPIIIFIPVFDFTGTEIIHEGDHEDEINNLPSMISSGMASSFAVLASPESLLAVVVFAIIIGFVIKTFKKSNNEYFLHSKKFFEILKSIIMKYIYFIMFLLPFAIATRMALIMLNPSPINEAGILAI